MTIIGLRHWTWGIIAGALLFPSVGFCHGVRYADLPRLPLYPHPYFDLPSHTVQITPKGYGKPITIHYKESGHGEPMLLIHGLMTSGYSFRYVIAGLSEHYRVIVPDLPGAGKSDAPADLSMTPQSMAEVISAFISALGLQKVYLVGNSLGGYETLWLALSNPEQVRRLAILHSPVFPDFKMRALSVALAAPGAHALYNWLVRRNPRQFVIDNLHYYNPSILSQQEVDEYAAIFHDPARTRVFWNILRQSMSPRHMHELATRLREVGHEITRTVPIVLLWATHDVLVSPDNGPRLQALIPDAGLIWFEQSSHFLQVDAPDRTVQRLLEFDSAE